MKTNQPLKAQTSVDFLIGISLFILTLLLVLQFATGSIVAINSGSSDKDAIADRTAELIINQEIDAGDGKINSSSLDTVDKSALAIPDLYRFNASIQYINGTTYTTADDDDFPAYTTASVSTKIRAVHDTDTNHTAVIEVKVW